MLAMSIAAANVAPDFSWRDKIVAEDLRRLEQPCVVFEHEGVDSDGERFYCYTVGGILDGKPLGGLQGGVTVGGDVIVVSASSRGEADFMAGLGLQDTIAALNAEEAAYIEAHAAKARLDSVGPIRRIDLATATAADRNEDFVRDAQAVERLRGDDIVLTVGGVEDAPPS